MASVTAIVLTKNEEKNINACIESIKGFAERILVVDSGSTDATTELAKAAGAEVVFHPFEYYAAQFNWGIENGDIRTDWVLRLDADERFTPELIEEVEGLLKTADETGANGIAMEADLYFLGRLMKHGLANKRKIMLFRYGHGGIEDRKRDAHTVLTDGGLLTAKHNFIHYDFKDLNSYIARYNWYTIRELSDYIDFESGASTEVNTEKRLMRHRKAKFGVYYRAPMFLRCKLWFLYNYIFKLGFLDGREGYLYHWFECVWYRMLVDAKIYEYRKTGKKPEKLEAFGK
ncbi:MAG: glycosyltransferase family 2 protein [Clostridia bacterium]|nr:glycosyltransferase family 2 protein [Clostridia bacterium]